MIVIKKLYEKLATDYSKRFAKDWSFFCVATDAYTSGYRQAKEDGIKHSDDSLSDYLLFANLGEELVEEEMLNGEHQLSSTTFLKWEKENKSLPFKEALAIYMLHYDFTDVRVEEKDGVVSFQGMCRKK